MPARAFKQSVYENGAERAAKTNKHYLPRAGNINHKMGLPILRLASERQPNSTNPTNPYIPYVHRMNNAEEPHMLCCAEGA